MQNCRFSHNKQQQVSSDDQQHVNLLKLFHFFTHKLHNIFRLTMEMSDDVTSTWWSCWLRRLSVNLDKKKAWESMKRASDVIYGHDTKVWLFYLFDRSSINKKQSLAHGSDSWTMNLCIDFLFSFELGQCRSGYGSSWIWNHTHWERIIE